MLNRVKFQNLGLFSPENQFQIQSHSTNIDGSLAILVGESGTGKTSVMEFIRRCMSKEITKSESNRCNPDQEAFVKCMFEFEPDIWKDLRNLDTLTAEVPVFIFNEQEDISPVSTLNPLAWFESVHRGMKPKVGLQLQTGLLYKMDGTKFKFILMAQKASSDREKQTDLLLLERSTCEGVKEYLILEGCNSLSNAIHKLNMPILECSWTNMDIQRLSTTPTRYYPTTAEGFTRLTALIETFELKFRLCLWRMTQDQTKCTEKFITSVYSTLFGKQGRVRFLFGHRGIGPLDSSMSDLMDEGHDNYNTTVTRAEIIAILDRLGEKQIREYKRLAKEITGNDFYEFKKMPNGRVVMLDKDHPGSSVELLKTPEGVYEAHVVALFIALQSDGRHRTLCLEEPNRCMHPSQVERLTEVILRTVKRKKVSIILTTHSRDMINFDTWIRTYCFRRDKQGLFLTHLPSNRKIMDLTTRGALSFADILWASKCLFVEGIRDQRFFHDFLRVWKSQKHFPFNIVNITIVELSGIQNFKHIKRFCQQIKVPHIFWLDGDVHNIQEDPSQHIYCWSNRKDVETTINDNLGETVVKKGHKKKDLRDMNTEDRRKLAHELMKKAKPADRNKGDILRFKIIVSRYENFVRSFDSNRELPSDPSTKPPIPLRHDSCPF